VAGSREARARIGFCPDTERLLDGLSGVEFVAWMLRYHGVSLAAARERGRAVLAELGLGGHMDRPIREYSKGMRQRVRLAQALAHEPRFVLLDEPMNGLDPVARRELGERLRQLPARGVGVLVSSHVLQELEGLVDRVVLLHQGRLLAEGRVAEIREQMPAIPHRVRVVAAQLRGLAALVASWDSVRAIRFDDGALEISMSGESDFYAALTELGAIWPGGLQEVTPLDDDLASVFGYLVR
jgi:ABC-2 type transport system ATP-binding protein